MNTEFSNISIVVIGFNESKNLDNTFKAIQRINYPKDKIEIIYIDSGSSDGSTDIAKKYTSKVFVEAKYPSAGRNRNRGMIESNSEIIHFIDGDVIIDPDYLINIQGLFNEMGVHAIVGQLGEQEPTIYNRMAGLNNAKKVEGFTNFTSTGATYLKAPLMKVNGYDERILRGQESELGERFREAGFKIWCTIHLMGSHNYNLKNLRKYLKKYRVDGKSLVQVSLISGESSFIKNARTRMFKNLIKVISFFIFTLLSVYLKCILPILIYFIAAWFIRNKVYFKRNFKTSSKLVLLRTGIDFFFFWVWWYGIFEELFKYLFRSETKSFYKLNKMQF